MKIRDGVDGDPFPLDRERERYTKLAKRRRYMFLQAYFIPISVIGGALWLVHVIRSMHMHTSE